MQAKKKNVTLRKAVTAGVLTALSVVLISVIRIPIIPSAPHLVLDGGDIPILLGGLLLGPWWGLAITVAASLIQAFIFSSDGIIGGVMHILASGMFVVVAGLIYKRWHTIKGAIIGLVSGGLAMVAITIPANLLITPWFYNMPFEAVAAMIPTAILPFNLIKAAVNILLMFLIYKPISNVLHRTGWL